MTILLMREISRGVIHMNRAVAFLIVGLMVTSLSFTPVLAATDQGLEWGVNTGGRFHFMLHVDGDGMLIDEEIYIIANATTPVPDSMTNWTDIPLDTLDAFYANDTEMGIEILLLLAAYNFVVPIGNWTFLNGLAESTLGVENFTLDDEDPYFWGYSWEDDNWTISGENWIIYTDYSLAVHVDFLKIDGFLAHYSVVATNRTTHENSGEITLERMGLEQYTDRTAPILSHPTDIAYEVGETGHNITWTVSEDNPAVYHIFKDGSQEIGGTWISSTDEFSISVDGLEIGTYNYTISVVDVGGNTASDEVIVTVQLPTNIPTDTLLFIGLGAGAVVVLLVVVVVLRKR